jgi:septal ring factor EnvC (AmiA/AmiB activator)
MNLKRWFAWACLALVLVAEVALFRAYRENDALQVQLRDAQTQLRQAQDELDSLHSSNAGLQAAEISRLRKQNQIITNQLAILQTSLKQLSDDSRSNSVHLATARTALRLQQQHLEQLQDESQQILDASVAVIARKTCINNLRLIDDAKQQWAMDFGKPETAVPTAKALLPYLKDNVFPECPGGGTIYLNAVNEVPTCSIPGHTLPQ